jgi:hypothetical protein
MVTIVSAAQVVEEPRFNLLLQKVFPHFYPPEFAAEGGFDRWRRQML